MIDKRLLLALAPVALLGACDDTPTETSTTPGEVLEGTISDAMLPVDQVRSQPPIEDPAVFAQTGEGARPGRAAGAGPAEAETDADGNEDTAEIGNAEEGEAAPAATPAAPAASDD